VECLTLLGVRDPSEFAKFLAIAAPKQSYLARPHAEVPRDAVNPGAYRRPPIPEWTLGFDFTLNAYTPVPLDQALTPQDAYHEVSGSPVNLAPGWDWKFDNKERRHRAIALRPKTPIPQWTQRFDPKLPIIGPITAVAYVAALERPDTFKRSRAILAPEKLTTTGTPYLAKPRFGFKKE
jgi:hypothetical protein